VPDSKQKRIGKQQDRQNIRQHHQGVKQDGDYMRDSQKDIFEHI